MIRFERFDDRELDTFRRRQRLSYDVLTRVMGRLEPGVTERDATRWVMQGYREAGADRFFHLPVALFGSRTGLPDPWTTQDFWPSERVLEPGDAVILDASPVFGGFVVDTAVSASRVPDAAHAAAAAADVTYRDVILTAVRSGATFREIAAGVDSDMTAAGYRNCHRLHPEGVLGHRAVRLLDPAGLPPPDPSGFDPTLLRWFIEGIDAAARGGSPSPTWNDSAGSDHRPASGLWAVEPHLAKGDVGVKWEELLVVEEHDAYWLDDDVPHMR